MNNILTVLTYVLILLIVSVPLLVFYIKERKARVRSEEMLSLVKNIGEVDDRIFVLRGNDPEGWSENPEAKMLIRRRINFHMQYSVLLGHKLLRDDSYVDGLHKYIFPKNSA